MSRDLSIDSSHVGLRSRQNKSRPHCTRIELDEGGQELLQPSSLLHMRTSALMGNALLARRETNPTQVCVVKGYLQQTKATCTSEQNSNTDQNFVKWSKQTVAANLHHKKQNILLC
eukprot:6224492-Amphidinium_carterae.1